MPLQIVHEDILRMPVDVIVDPTDASYSGSGGVDRQIHAAAGPDMDALCAALPPLSVGDVRETPGFGLSCRYVLHTVGPMWHGGGENEAALLRSCYVNALMRAVGLGASSIAFPLISAGTFGFPRDRVMRLAVQAVSEFLLVNDCEPDVYICVIDRDAYDVSVGPELARFLAGARRSAPRRRAADEPAAADRIILSARELPEEPLQNALPAEPSDRVRPSVRGARRAPAAKKTLTVTTNAPTDLESWLKTHDDTFAVTLLKLIDRKGMTEVECYKRANVSRKTFSKINTDREYRPSKPTVIAFAIALRLNVEETGQLLRTVGFSLSHSETFDLIIEYCIRREIWDVGEVNAILYKYDQPCLGC